MSPAVIMFAVGTLLLVFTQRWAMLEEQRLLVAILAVLLAYVGGAVVRWVEYKKHADSGVRFAHRVAFVALAVTLVALGLYGLTTDALVQRMNLDDEAEAAFVTLLGWVWPLVWSVAAAVYVAVDLGVRSSPVMTPPARVVALGTHGALIAMAVALVFPLNYVASQRNERWDLGYFKTPTPGSATRALAESLESPVDVRVFMPASSEVAQEIRHYFEDLASPNLRLTVLDQAASPRLSKALQVRENGVVALTLGEVDLDEEPEAKTPEAKAPGEVAPAEPSKPQPVTRTLRISTEFESAKRTLRKLDAEVQRLLIELGHGERIAYLTTGHGELETQGAKGILDREGRGLKERLGQLGFTVKMLGLSEGLAEKVPEDADVVLVLGPHYPFQAAEVDALRTYLQAGGSLLVALEPWQLRESSRRGGAAASGPLELLLEQDVGVVLGDGVLAAEKGIVPLTHDRLDRLHIVTDSFTSHPSSRTVAQHAASSPLFTPAAGYLEETKDHATSVTFTVRSLAFTWADLNLNAEYEADEGESKGARNLVAAVTGGDGAGQWRAIVASDASMFSDLAMGSRGNVMFLDDAVNWLIGAEGLAGTTQSEEDVKIEHTKEGQGGWFYSTVLGVPMLVMILGAVWLRFRRRPFAPTGGTP